MHDITKSPTRNRRYAQPVCAALECLEGLLVEGLKHGNFEYAINCKTGNHGRRLLIIRAGKSYSFTILDADVPR
jgi:hypothetical protein